MTASSQIDQQPKNFFPRLWSTRVDLLLLALFLLITALYVLLMITDRVPLWGWLALLGLFLLHWLASSRLSLPSPLNLPVFLLLLLTLLNLFLTVDSALTLPKVNGLVLSIALFFVLANFFGCKRRPGLAVWALLLLALGTALLCLSGAAWPDAGDPVLSWVYAHLPSLLRFSPRSSADLGMNGNTIGGAIIFFIPLLISLLWQKKRPSYHTGDEDSNSHPHGKRLFTALLVLLLLFLLALLILSRSRGALLGCAAGVFLVMMLKNKRFFQVIPLGLSLLFAVWLIFANGSLSQLIDFLDTSPDPTLPSRLELWRAALYQIQDFPLTGAGLGAFNTLFADFYSIQGQRAFHAHNIFLTVAADMGIPALVLYTALLGGFASMAVKVHKVSGRQTRHLVVGLSAGMAAHLVFGFTDSFILGSKLAVIFWVYLGIMSGLYIGKVARPGRLALGLLLGLLGWVLASLLALSFVNLVIYVSLFIALLGGSLLGVQQVSFYQAGRS